MEDEGVAVLVLHVQGRPLAVDMQQVETLRRKETVYPPPPGVPGLLGFLPLGTTLVPIVDLGSRLGMSQRGGTQTGLLVVPPEAVTPLAFYVDQVAGPIHLSWNDLALVPDLVRELQPRPITWAMARQGDEVVPLLDLRQLVPPEEVATLLEMAAHLA